MRRIVFVMALQVVLQKACWPLDVVSVSCFANSPTEPTADPPFGKKGFRVHNTVIADLLQPDCPFTTWYYGRNSA